MHFRRARRTFKTFNLIRLLFSLLFQLFFNEREKPSLCMLPAWNLHAICSFVISAGYGNNTESYIKILFTREYIFRKHFEIKQKCATLP